MTDLRKAAQMALEAFDTWLGGDGLHPDETNDLALRLASALAQPEPFNPDWNRVNALEESLREHMAEIHRLKALAQPEQEPVAYQWLGTSVIRKRIPKTAEADAWQPLYTAPPQRKPLTVDQISEIDCYDHLKFARRIEKAHGIEGEV